jgi:hypothetical protein
MRIKCAWGIIEEVSMLKIALAIAMVGVLPTLALAAPCATAVGCGGHPAPAPLLAAGIPAFAALGGGALVARLRRRWRERAQTASSQSTTEA